MEKEEEEIVGKAVARLPIQYVKPLLLHLKTKIEVNKCSDTFPPLQ